MRAKGIDGWRIDQILTSDFFGMKSARGLKYEKLMEKRRKLINKTNPLAADKKKLKDIEAQLNALPTGENPEQIENREYVAELIEKFRNSDRKIEL